MEKKGLHDGIQKMDPRFSTILSDPKFDVMSKKERKVVIDRRFREVLRSKKFASKSNMDMRGRLVNLSSRNAWSNVYELGSDSDGLDGSENEIRIDLARGNGNVTSSSDDSSDSELDVDDESEKDHCWGEVDRDAHRVEWASSRLALCNMEWDRVTATDLFVLLSSFKPPPPAAILSVSIYISDFGKEKLEEEERLGPQFKNVKNKKKENAAKIDLAQEALRRYQLERMRYYYAIIECDSIKTASALYEACDGVEFETSAIKLDLRFVPDDMNFAETTTKEKITNGEVDVSSFQPKKFESSALSKSAAKLTWDETDPERIKAQREAFLPNADFDRMQQLIAPCSSDEEVEDDSKGEALLSEAKNEAFANKSKSAMEVVWETEPVNDNSKTENKATPWEKYLDKRKMKRSERRAAIAELKRKRKAESNGDVGNSDQEVILHSKTPKKKDKNMGNGFLEDERFEALYENSAFAIDQSHPLFKPSNLAVKQAEEKKKKMKRKVTSHDEDESAIALALTNKLKKKMSSVGKDRRKVV